MRQAHQNFLSSIYHCPANAVIRLFPVIVVTLHEVWQTFTTTLRWRSSVVFTSCHFTRQWGCFGGKDCYLKINIFHIRHKHSCRLLCTALLSLDRLRLSSVFLLPVLFLVGQFNSLLLWVWSMCLMDWICNTIFPGQIGHCTVCTKVVVTYWPAP